MNDGFMGFFKYGVITCKPDQIIYRPEFNTVTILEVRALTYQTFTKLERKRKKRSCNSAFRI